MNIDKFINKNIDLIIPIAILLMIIGVYWLISWVWRPSAELKNKKLNIINTNDQGQLMCPNCNSTQIQLVPRKWSMLTGIMTNKVDRVCVHCKHKF